jgi:hypothetical protein
MKLKFPLVLIILAMHFCAQVKAQPLNRLAAPAPAENIFLKQADSLKKLFALQGFEIIKEANLEMKSQYETPIILSLKEGTWYRIIFIADKSSKLYEVRMYDWNEKQVVYEKQKPKDMGGNIINYDYIPRFTEFHMIKPVQINKKKKDIMGTMLLFKKTIKA